MSVRATNSLLGTALGDSLGLVFEGLPARRVATWKPLPLRQRLIVGRGAVSDDSAQAAMVAIAYLRHPDSPELAARAFSRMLRQWFWSLPPGIGLSTAKACLRLSAGIRPSGVPSAGNGAAMRVAALGPLIPESRRDEFVTAFSEVTHRHPLAIEGAKIVAFAAAAGVDQFEEEHRRRFPTWDFDSPVPAGGPTGYVVHTVQAALGVWRQHPTDLERGLETAIQLGGDTDSVAAIVGGLIGAQLDELSVSEAWCRWVGWPNRQTLLNLSSETRFPFGRSLATNLALLPVILGHGFRRLGPPY